MKSIVRLGKLNSLSSGPTKVFLENAENVCEVLKKKTTLQGPEKIQADLTYAQRSYYKNLLAEVRKPETRDYKKIKFFNRFPRIIDIDVDRSSTASHLSTADYLNNSKNDS